MSTKDQTKVSPKCYLNFDLLLDSCTYGTGRRGVHTTKAHHGRSPQSTAGGKDDIAQKRIRNLQQKV